MAITAFKTLDHEYDLSSYHTRYFFYYYFFKGPQILFFRQSEALMSALQSVLHRHLNFFIKRIRRYLGNKYEFNSDGTIFRPLSPPPSPPNISEPGADDIDMSHFNWDFLDA